MQYTKLGNSDLNIFRIRMGRMGFGNAGSGRIHALAGIMAQNTAAAAKEKHVRSVGNQKI